MARRPARRSVSLRRQRQALAVVHDRLRQCCGTPVPERHLDPLDELVLTILSQNTNDTNRDRAWARLKERFRDWEEVAEAPVQQLERALRPGGLHRVKARRIQQVLAQVRRDQGAYCLDSLRDLGMAQAREQLQKIPGLGAKSVNCILLFSLGYPAFPVDTHVYRVLGRLGVHRAKTLTQANRELQQAVPEGAWYSLHVNLIRHGRSVCHARRPACEECVLRDLCQVPLQRAGAPGRSPTG